MTHEILMPSLSPTMTEGTLARWLVKEGDQVKSGDIIAEIETDKATMEVESIEDGVIGRLIVADGTQGVAVNSIIAILLEEGEDPKSLVLNSRDDSVHKSDSEVQSEEGKTKEDESSSDQTSPISENTTTSSRTSDGRIRISPLARKMSELHKLDMSKISGSGPQGRIIKRDIEKVLSEGNVQIDRHDSHIGTDRGLSTRKDPLFPNHRVEPHRSIRKIIAKRLTESKQTIPHFYLNIEAVIDDLLSFRKQVNEDSAGKYKVSVNDLIVKGVAHALMKEPRANVSFGDEGVLYFDSADVAVAVATDEGLITPIVRDAQTRGLIEISNIIKDYAKRARDGKLLPEEYQGGTFTVSNLGMFGIDNFAPIINPPQACILGIGRGREVPIFEDDKLIKKNVITMTLSVDHRVVDGAIGAEFLRTLKGYLESPATMIL